MYTQNKSPNVTRIINDNTIISTDIYESNKKRIIH